MPDLVEDDDWEQSNEDDWHKLANAVDQILLSVAEIPRADFEVSAVRDSPSTIDVLLHSNSVSTKDAVLSHCPQLQAVLAGHSDHWVIRIFVRPANWPTLDNYEYLIWIEIRRAMFRKFLGRSSVDKWQDAAEMDREVWLQE